MDPAAVSLGPDAVSFGLGFLATVEAAWQRRIAKRCNIVERIKGSPEYASCARDRVRGVEETPTPPTA